MSEKKKTAVVISLNPCVDRTVWIEKFLYGGTNRVQRRREDVSGKGVNVCMALQALGQECICVGFDYSGSRHNVSKLLEEQGIAHEMVMLPGELRMNMKLFESSTGVMSEVNEKGSEIPQEALQELLEKYGKILADLAPESFVLLTGSVPPGVPADIYAQMIRMAKEYGIRTLLDASGEPLLRGMEAVPFASKPNEDEIRLLLNREVRTLDDASSAARELVQRGGAICCVSLGAQGAVLASGIRMEEQGLASASGINTNEQGLVPAVIRTYHAPALPVEVRGIQGAGDSLVAGMTLALLHGETAESVCGNDPDGDMAQKALRFAMAAAGASVMRDGTQMCTREDFDALLPKVQIREI